jgi:hypothetical protein
MTPDLGLVGHLHRDDANAVFAPQLEQVGEALGAPPLEVVGTGAGLVGARAGRDDAVLGQGREHGIHILARVYGAQPREEMEGLLADADAVVLEAHRLEAAPVASDGAELLGDSHGLFHALELLEGLDGDHAGGAEQVDLGERAGSPLDLVQLGRHAGVALGELHHTPHLGGVGLDVCLHDDDHGEPQ